MSEAVLVSGAFGFVGRHLIPALASAGVESIPYSLRAETEPDLSGMSIRRVFHLAGKTYVPESWQDPVSFYEANALGTAKVLELSRRLHAPVTLISSYVYGKPVSLPISEDAPLQPFNPYAHSKIIAEQIAKFYQDSFSVPVTIIRPFNLYGPYQDERFLIPTLIKQVLDPLSQAITVNDLRPRRDYLFIADFVDLLIRTMEQPVTGCFNAGSGASTSISELCEILAGLTESPKRVVSRQNERSEEVLDVVADISKARAAFGWAPATSLAQGLALTFSTARSQQGRANA